MHRTSFRLPVRRPAILSALILALGCQSPPASTPVSTTATDPVDKAQPAHQAAPRPTVVAPAAPFTAAPVAEPASVEGKNAADLEAMRAALQRAVQPSPARTESRPQEEAAAHAETLTERDLAAARESLPALQERMQQIIPRYFDAESFRRALTNHPEFRKGTEP